MKKKRLFALITSAFFILSACGTAAANQEDNSWSNVEKKNQILLRTILVSQKKEKKNSPFQRLSNIHLTV